MKTHTHTLIHTRAQVHTHLYAFFAPLPTPNKAQFDEEIILRQKQHQQHTHVN
jgi:hypothetical protein